MSKKKCKHNGLKTRLANEGKHGKQNGYCSQCQKWVYVDVENRQSRLDELRAKRIAMDEEAK